MARKRKSGDDGGINLDSLMDALTNVVAVLILVLVLVQANASRIVQKILDDPKPATPEEIVASKANLEELEKKKEQLKEKRSLALLEKSLEENKVALADLDKLREIEKKIRAERDEENKVTTAIQEEIAKLEAMLDQTPVIKPDTPTVVNIPNSRPIPGDAIIYYGIALRGRLHIIDPVTPRELFEGEFKQNRQDWLVERIKMKGADRYIYDGVKIANHFKTFEWKNKRGQKIEVLTYPTAAHPDMAIIPGLEKGGTPTADLAKKGSEFFNAALELKQDFKSVLLFRVGTDSFETYLEARSLADKANIAAGWEINGSQEYRVRIADIEVKRLETPPPPPPGTTPPPPGPPPLKPKLD